MCVSPLGEYFLFYSAFCGQNESEYIALTTRTKGLNKKACEIGVESALVTDAGIGYFFSDEGDLHILTAEKKTKRHLCNDPEAYLLVPQGCFVAVTSDTSKLEDHEQVIVKGFLFDSGKSWKRSIDFEVPDDYNDISIELSNDNIIVTMPNKSIVSLSLDGTILK